MSTTYVPLISSGTAGPLGVLHLPRLWQKVSLEAAGKLASGYPGCGKGYDAMTLGALGLDEQATKDFVKNNKPTYPQFEAWVKANGKSVSGLESALIAPIRSHLDRAVKDKHLTKAQEQRFLAGITKGIDGFVTHGFHGMRMGHGFGDHSSGHGSSAPTAFGL